MKSQELRLRNESCLLGGGIEKIESQHRAGKLTARERMALLLDPGSFVEIERIARHRQPEYGLDFDSIDGQATHLFFLLVVPEHSGGQHLKALARISRFLRDASFRKRLLEAGTRDEVLRAIEEEDAKF